MYLLDTNVVSELRRSRPHGAVLAWLESTDDNALLLSAVSIGEIQRGIEITKRHDTLRAGEIEAWLDQVIATYKILDMDAAAFRTWSRLMDGKADALIEDAMIAATAKVHNLVVVTRNVVDFTPFGVLTLNPFEPTLGGS